MVSADRIITMKPVTKNLCDFLGGFVAAEGYFGFDEKQPKFRFALGLGAQDQNTCRIFQKTLGIGRVYTYTRRKSHYDDEVTYVVQSLKELVQVIVPFMDDHLPTSYKRIQYEKWREDLLSYWEHKARKIRVCSVKGCNNFRRSHGVCRKHLWQLYKM